MTSSFYYHILHLLRLDLSIAKPSFHILTIISNSSLPFILFLLESTIFKIYWTLYNLVWTKLEHKCKAYFFPLVWTFAFLVQCAKKFTTSSPLLFLTNHALLHFLFIAEEHTGHCALLWFSFYTSVQLCSTQGSPTLFPSSSFFSSFILVVLVYLLYYMRVFFFLYRRSPFSILKVFLLFLGKLPFEGWIFGT